MLQRHGRCRHWVPTALRRSVGRLVAHGRTLGLRGRNYEIGFMADTAQSIAHINTYFDSVARRRLLRRALRNGGALPETYKGNLSNATHSVLRRATETDFRSTMVDSYLV